MSKKKTDWTNVIIATFAVAVIILATAVVIFYQTNKTTRIDAISGIDGPYLSGNITIEVDYMAGYEPTTSDLDAITAIYERYGLGVTFIVNDSVTHNEELDDSEARAYYNLYCDNLGDSWILFSDKYKESSVLGCIYNASRIYIFMGQIDASFSNAYRSEAYQWVTCHEINHAYGAVHQNKKPSYVMYPLISVALLDSYDIRFCSETQEELLN